MRSANEGNARLKTYWFEAKRFGIGWTLPATWQGWMVVAIYFSLMGLGVVALPDVIPYWVLAAVLTVSLIAVIAWKGERPFKWRWGDD